MKKVFFAVAVALLSVCGATAQSDRPMFGWANRVGVGLGVGTEGIGIDASTCLSKYLGVRLGVNIMPDINIKTDADIEPNASDIEQIIASSLSVKGSLKRTTVDLKVDCYPTGGVFFVTAGFSMGGSKLLRVKGHSDEIANQQALAKDYGIQIGDYNIPFDENGDVRGGLKVSGFRPYLGLGVGRLVPKNRVTCRLELGVQFHGKPKVYAGGLEGDDLLNEVDEDSSNDIKKIMDNFKVWPVLKFSIRGRIL